MRLQDCDIYRSIISLAIAPVGVDRTLRLGTNKELAAGNCQRHMSMFDSFGMDFWDKTQSSNVSAWKNARDFGLVTLSEKEDLFNMSHLSCMGSLYNYFKILDSEWIRIPLLKQWKLTCENSHRRNKQSLCLNLSSRILPTTFRTQIFC